MITPTTGWSWSSAGMNGSGGALMNATPPPRSSGADGMYSLTKRTMSAARSGMQNIGPP